MIPAMARLIDNLDLVAHGELARVKRMCGVDDEDFADMLAELRSYDPRPGLRFEAGGGDPVTPDVLLTPSVDAHGQFTGWDIALNQATLPRLIVNRCYYVELKTACGGKGDKGWLSEKLADANWLIKALDQRAKTILKVASEIVVQQDAFFRHGIAHLRPLTLRAVAEAIGMHESTVSRVTSNKYLSCPRGTYELKFFFTSGVGVIGRRGRGFGRGGQGRHPPADRSRDGGGDPVGRRAGRSAQSQRLRSGAADGGEIPRGDRAGQLGAAAAAEGAGGGRCRFVVVDIYS